MKTVSVDEMGNAIAKEFEDYVELSASKVKTIVKDVADDVKKKIQENAPVDTGAYKSRGGLHRLPILLLEQPMLFMQKSTG